MIIVLQRLVYLIILVTCLLTVQSLPFCSKYEECVHRIPDCHDHNYRCLRRSCWCSHGKICMLAGEVYECFSYPNLIDVGKQDYRSRGRDFDEMIN